MYNIGDKVRVLRVPGRPDIRCPFKTEVTSIGCCCFSYGVKKLAGQDVAFDEWGVNESDLEPIEKTMKNTITIEEYNKIFEFSGPFIPTVWVEYMVRYGSMNMNNPQSIEKLWPFLNDFQKKMLINAGYSPDPINWSKVEFGAKIKNKDINDCSIRRFLKFEKGRVWFWNETSNESWPATPEHVILAE